MSRFLNSEPPTQRVKRLLKEGWKVKKHESALPSVWALGFTCLTTLVSPFEDEFGEKILLSIYS